jgi:hypothetical protein
VWRSWWRVQVAIARGWVEKPERSECPAKSRGSRTAARARRLMISATDWADSGVLIAPVRVTRRASGPLVRAA